MKIGCHVSISGSIDLAFDRAKEIGCNTFQIFTKNPRSWAAKKLSSEEVEKFQQKSKNEDLYPVFAHISYLPNLASLNQEVYRKSLNSFLLEIRRCVSLSIPYFVIHSGSYKGGTFDEGFNRYISSIQKGVEEGRKKTVILIENSVGGRNSITGDLKSIAKVLDEINDRLVVKVCFDTCHAFGAGYDLRNEKVFSKTLDQIESSIGLENIAVIHANDIKTGLGSRRDLHEHIGLGEIGEDGFRTMINNPYLKKIPWIIETPVNEIRGDRENISYLLSLIRNE